MENEAEFRSFLKNALTSPSRPVAFFAGAGISVDSGLPDFWTFSTHVIRCVTGHLEAQGATTRSSVLSENEIRDLASQLRPEVVMQTLYEQFGIDLFEAPNPNHEFLARAMRKGHCVFTTNVDRLIEAAYWNLCREEARVCVQEKDYEEFLRQEPLDGQHLFQPGWLLKLHGTLGPNGSDKKQRYGTIQFALNQVGQGLASPKAEALQRCFQTTDFCFLGYSGCDHFSVQPILRNTPSKGSLYWLWFDALKPSCRWEADKSIFQQMQREAEQQIASGESYAQIDRTRGWEKLSVGEILTASDRANVFRWIGHTGQLLREILQTPPFPGWLGEISPFQQHLAAGELLRRAHKLSLAEKHCEHALNLATTDRERADAHRVLADVFLVPSTPDKDRECEKQLLEATAVYESLSLAELDIETKLALANVYRRMKNYPEAQKVLQKAESRLPNISAVDVHTRLEARLGLLYGLVLGLSGRSEVSNTEAAVSHLTKAVNLATSAGLVATRSSALNSLGLVAYQAAGRDLGRLREAEKYLMEALVLNTRIGDARGCFQQCRNLGLIHTRLADIALEAGACQENQDYLNAALEDYENAEKFLEQFPERRALGELLETQFRKGEVLVRKGELQTAENLLSKLQDERRQTGDWHNEARTLELLLETTDDRALLESRLQRIAAIYEDVSRSPEQLGSFTQFPIRHQQNAVEILCKARELASRYGLGDLAGRISNAEQRIRAAQA
jgi:tetratricopeptide (TPR) repeat protein